MPKKNWEYAAGLVWPLLIQAAARREKRTYGDVASKIGTNPLSVRNALGPIQDFCLEGHLPPLTAIVVNANTGVPGDGFVAWNVDDLGAAHEAVFAFDWSAVPNPYGGYGQTDTTDTLADQLVSNPDRAEDVYAKVKVRGTAQRIFRLALLKVYQSGCAFCGITFDATLDAAHIKAWQECSSKERLATRNGLLLCAIHHRLFDAGLMTLDKGFRVAYYDPKGKDGPYSDADRRMSIDLHGKGANLPADEHHRPDPALLAWRRKVQDW